MRMNPENFELYKIDFTEYGWARREKIVGLKSLTLDIRGEHGYPFFSCKIALCNANGDKEEAIRLLKKAFGY